MKASFEEKSVWLQLVGTVLVLGSYFVAAGRLMARGVTQLVAYVPLFAGAVILLVLTLVAGHIVVAIASRPEGRDERDRQIEWRAQSGSGWIVVAGAFTAILGLIVSIDGVWIAHLLLLSVLLSEVARFVLQLVYYRRGLAS